MAVINYRENVNAPWQELAVSSVSVGDLPEEALTVSGNCQYRFINGGWDWYINGYGDKVTTKDITAATGMFNSSKTEEIPFELNFKPATSISMDGIFQNCQNLKAVPKINNCQPKDISNFFDGCYNLREIPEDIGDWFDWSAVDGATYQYASSRASQLDDCRSLRSAPIGFLAHGNPNAPTSYGIYYYGFNNCYALDELIDVPNPHLNATWTSNAFSNFVSYCYRLKNLTFKCPDGKPYVVKWKNQTIDCATLFGFCVESAKVNLFNYNSGITADKEVYDDATYQALKNDADWFATDRAYSRYNHDSAVATINSLPDASAYLATAGGTNTIKFKKDAGSKTDGGSVSALTEEEIAVATAKGWTVTFVS